MLHGRVDALSIIYVNPSVPGNPFWDRVSKVAIAAARDLNIDLEIVYGKDNRNLQFQTIDNLAKRDVKPDYLVISPWFGNSEDSFNAINNAKIPFITVERTLLDKEQKEVGLPQEKYKYWLGEIFHDNIYSGELLARELVRQANINHVTKKNMLTAIAISGSF